LYVIISEEAVPRASNSEPLKIGPFRVAPHVRSGKPSGNWLVDLPPHLAPGGKRKRAFFQDRASAIAEAKRLLRELQLKGVLAGYGLPLADLTFAEAAKLWLEEQADRVATGKKRRISLETDAYWMRPLLAMFAASDLANIAPGNFVTYQKARLDAAKSPSTVNSEVALLVRVLTWAAARGLLGKVPTVELIPVPRKRVSLPTPDEVVRVIEYLPPSIGLLVRFLAETGCRKGEAFALEWSDVDEVNGIVSIRRKAGFTPKTQHSDRDIPIGGALLSALRAAPKTTSYVFPGRHGSKMTDFDKALARAIRAAGVTRHGEPMHITPHMLRKAHATWQKMRGLDDNLLQPRLGHAPGSRITSRTYVHVPDDAMRGTVFNLPVARRSS
jgi:integrase